MFTPTFSLLPPIHISSLIMDWMNLNEAGLAEYSAIDSMNPILASTVPLKSDIHISLVTVFDLLVHYSTLSAS